MVPDGCVRIPAIGPAFRRWHVGIPFVCRQNLRGFPIAINVMLPAEMSYGGVIVPGERVAHDKV